TVSPALRLAGQSLARRPPPRRLGLQPLRRLHRHGPLARRRSPLPSLERARKSPSRTNVDEAQDDASQVPPRDGNDQSKIAREAPSASLRASESTRRLVARGRGARWSASRAAQVSRDRGDEAPRGEC